MLFDAMVRFSGAGMLVLLMLFVARDLNRVQGAPYLFLACLSLLCAYLGFTIEPFELPPALSITARFLDIPHLVFVWIFALSIFETKFKLRLFHLAVGLGYTAPILFARLAQLDFVKLEPQPFAMIAEIFSLALMAHLVFAILKERRDDMLDKRRRARVYFVMVIVFVASVTSLGAAADFRPFGMTAQTLWVVSVWPGIFWACYWLLGGTQLALTFQNIRHSNKKVSQEDQKILTALEALMVHEEAYRSNSLKITSLASKLGVTQHRLRGLINQELGYQNFNEFVNTYRLEAVKKAMLESDTRHLPILTIAMDCGFNSLSPFNRVFRERENMTPSEYRHRIKERDRSE